MRGFFLAWLWLAGAACAAVPELTLDAARQPFDLVPYLQTELVAPGDLDPETLWRGGVGTPVPPERRWELRPGQTWVGRISLRARQPRDTWVLQIPALQVDDVQVWHRTAGGAWQAARAGDRIALSRWPYPSQFPVFPLPLAQEPLDLVVAASNDGYLLTPVQLWPDEQFRASQIRRANLSGVLMGLSLMVTVVCVITAMVLGGRAPWELAGVAAWTTLVMVAGNGYMALWFTPDAPGLNDGARHFCGTVLAGLMVALTVASVDQRFVGRGQRGLARVAPAASLGFAASQVLFLPAAWRPVGGLLWLAAAVALCVAVALLNALRGGRYVGWVAGGAAALAGVIPLALLPPDLLPGIDARAHGIGVLFCASLLCYRQALVAADRYGTAVLGRAELGPQRDPLTALLSAAGFEQACERAVLRQQAGQASAGGLMLLDLAAWRDCGAQHGQLATERAMVRLAAAVHGSLGAAWVVARLSDNYLAALRTVPADGETVQAEATRLLARCTRVDQPFMVVSAFDLRIAWTVGPLPAEGVARVLLDLQRAAADLPAGKRIATL